MVGVCFFAFPFPYPRLGIKPTTIVRIIVAALPIEKSRCAYTVHMLATHVKRKWKGIGFLSKFHTKVDSLLIIYQ